VKNDSLMKKRMCFAGRCWNSPVTFCSGLHDEVKVESETPSLYLLIDQVCRDASFNEDLLTLMQERDEWCDRQNIRVYFDLIMMMIKTKKYLICS